MTTSDESRPTVVVPPAPVLIARSVWLEIRRREEYQALFVPMAVYLAFAFGARLVGANQREAQSLMLNMGLSMSAALSAILTLVTAARLIPAEIESGTLYPLLAKPVHRYEVLLGKFLASVAAGWGAFAVFTLLTRLFTVGDPEQSSAMFLQACTLQLVALFLLCSISFLFSMLLPKSAAILLAGLLYFGWTPLANIVRSTTRSTWCGWILEVALSFVPDFSQLTLLQRFTDGGSRLPWGECFLLGVYGVVPALLALAASNFLFERKSL